MLSAKLIIHKRTSKLHQFCLVIFVLFLFDIPAINAQDNSPYSRYGMGDLHPATNILNRGMGSISAAYSDQFSINFSNPATYSRFFSMQEVRTKKMAYGRMILDVGINFDNRTLREYDRPENFTVPDAYFSYLQLGVPLKKNWGMVMGIRPVSKIGYQVSKSERLYNSQTNEPIDSIYTEFTGTGGSYLATLGTGFAIKNFSVGANFGYMFGQKEYSTRRIFINDTVDYNNSIKLLNSTFGDLFFNMGMQYRIDLKKDKSKYLQLGANGNIKQKIGVETTDIRETFNRSADGSIFRLDSVYQQVKAKGVIDLPANFGGGFLIEQLPDVKKMGWLVGVDYIYTGWDDYRFNGQMDSVKTNWQLRVGTQIKPSMKEAKYKNLMSYRFGMFFGDSYVHLNKKLPERGITAGVSLPIANLKDASRRFRSQYSVINISAEYIKRGSKNYPLWENLFRISAGFTLSDLWFTKRKYD